MTNHQVDTSPKIEPVRNTEQSPASIPDQEIKVIEQGTGKLLLDTGKKLGKDGCGY